jgi:hypothetical protein
MMVNLKPLKSEVQGLCESEQGLCYNDKFIGPIKEMNINSSDNFTTLYFVSLFEPDVINVTDFTYEQSLNDFTKGNLFGLFMKDSLEVSRDEKSLLGGYKVGNRSVKVLKNIGRKIQKVRIFDKSIFNNHTLRDGIMIKYESGDFCLNDRSKKYQSYLFLKCEKNFQSNAPVLAMKFQSNN